MDSIEQATSSESFRAEVNEKMGVSVWKILQIGDVISSICIYLIVVAISSTLFSLSVGNVTSGSVFLVTQFVFGGLLHLYLYFRSLKDTGKRLLRNALYETLAVPGVEKQHNGWVSIHTRADMPDFWQAERQRLLAMRESVIKELNAMVEELQLPKWGVTRKELRRRVDGLLKTERTERLLKNVRDYRAELEPYHSLRGRTGAELLSYAQKAG